MGLRFWIAKHLSPYIPIQCWKREMCRLRAKIFREKQSFMGPVRNISCAPHQQACHRRCMGKLPSRPRAQFGDLFSGLSKRHLRISPDIIGIGESEGEERSADLSAESNSYLLHSSGDGISLVASSGRRKILRLDPRSRGFPLNIPGSRLPLKVIS
jgi:hypothetical protein